MHFYNGWTLLKTISVDYGSVAIYPDQDPVKPGVQNPDMYKFIGWSPKPEAITGEMSYYAQYEFLGYIKDSWTDIAVKVADGSYLTAYKPGELKSLTLKSGITIDVELVGIDHDDLADGTGKAGTTWIVKTLTGVTSPMNYGSTSNAGGWNTSYMRTTTMQTMYNNLPDELCNVIKPVIKKASAGNISTEITESIDTLWIPALLEVYNMEDVNDVYKQEGSMYPVYVDDTSRQKYLSNGITLSPYWTRSANATSKYGFYYISTDGDPITSGSDSNFGIAFGFCI